jgi:hypothetical protein
VKNEEKTKKVIGRAEIVRFPDLDEEKVHARIDSGARTSAIWGSAHVNDDDKLIVSFFGNTSKTYEFTSYGQQVVSSSNGQVDKRYTIRLLVIISGKKIRATFTIANRVTQVYPVLIGRNVLRGKFVVDVKLGRVLKTAEKEKIAHLQSLIEKEKLL